VDARGLDVDNRDLVPSAGEVDVDTRELDTAAGEWDVDARELELDNRELDAGTRGLVTSVGGWDVDARDLVPAPGTLGGSVEGGQPAGMAARRGDCCGGVAAIALAKDSFRDSGGTTGGAAAGGVGTEVGDRGGGGASGGGGIGCAWSVRRLIISKRSDRSERSADLSDRSEGSVLADRSEGSERCDFSASAGLAGCGTRPEAVRPSCCSKVMYDFLCTRLGWLVRCTEGKGGGEIVGGRGGGQASACWVRLPQDGLVGAPYRAEGGELQRVWSTYGVFVRRGTQRLG
jgi:hypothetical protein